MWGYPLSRHKICKAIFCWLLILGEKIFSPILPLFLNMLLSGWSPCQGSRVHLMDESSESAEHLERVRNWKIAESCQELDQFPFLWTYISLNLYFGFQGPRDILYTSLSDHISFSFIWVFWGVGAEGLVLGRTRSACRPKKWKCTKWKSFPT